MAMRRIEGPDLKKPLCYDPARKKFILYEEIVSGAEIIIPVDTLSDDDFKKLIIERHLAGPDYSVQAMTGPPLSRNDVIRAIELDEPFGKLTLDAERSYLLDLLREIKENLG
jgi:hypothetical protein